MNTTPIGIRIFAFIAATLVTAFGVSPYDFVFYAGQFTL